MLHSLCLLDVAGEDNVTGQSKKRKYASMHFMVQGLVSGVLASKVLPSCHLDRGYFFFLPL